jgi:hypothetical protein
MITTPPVSGEPGAPISSNDLGFNHDFSKARRIACASKHVVGPRSGNHPHPTHA